MGRSYYRSGGSSASSGKSGGKQHYAYSLNLAGGRKYVGITTNPERRLAQHFGGQGAQWTQKHAPVSVNHLQRCSSAGTAKSAERIITQRMKNYWGSDKVRGAGHTSSK